MPTQRAIVAKIEQLLSDLDNGIANLKTVNGKLEIYRQSVLKKAFEGELTKEWREKQTDLPTADELLEKIKEEHLKHYENQIQEWRMALAEWEEEGKKGKKHTKPKKPTNIPEIKDEDLETLNTIPGLWVKIIDCVLL